MIPPEFIMILFREVVVTPREPSLNVPLIEVVPAQVKLSAPMDNVPLVRTTLVLTFVETPNVAALAANVNTKLL